ncbi:MAG: hypothetical protein H6719_16320 [Sandaracinaceae bacterium]|nr:hypothetical protein [Sandaracinaceae bacterium]
MGRRSVFWAVGAVTCAGIGAAAWLLHANYPVARAAVEHAAAGGPVPRVSVLDALRPTPRFGSPPEPGTPAAARVVATLEQVERTTRATSYQHRTRVDARRGLYHWDCSGMTAWVLARSAPRARRSLGQGRPVARTFARHIARAPTDRPRRGWQRVEHIRDVRPGDVFAWERPPDFPSNNTGHVGFVMNQPVAVGDGVWAVRILDSTSYAHQDDTRGEGETGTGRGTMTFLTDGAGHAEAYGWHGTRSYGYIETPVVFGRVR